MPPRNPNTDAAETEPDAVIFASEPAPSPPGPIQLEIRVNGKIACLQRVHSYTIDQDTTQIAVYGNLTTEPKP